MGGPTIEKGRGFERDGDVRRGDTDYRDGKKMI